MGNTTCAQIDRDDATLQRLVCEVYAADYTCFGYKRPDHCARESATKAESRGTPTQTVLEQSLPSEVAMEGNSSIAPEVIAAANALLQAPSIVAPADTRV